MNVESKRIKHSFIVGNNKLYGRRTKERATMATTTTRM